jgi:RNA polymerase sigma factor (sigma-70 family)
MTAPSEKQRLAEFLRTEYLKLLGFVRRRVDAIAAQDAEDFVHDVAVQLFDKADIAAPIEHLSAYVYRSLQNRIADYFRKRRPAPDQRGSEPEKELPSLDHVVEASGYGAASEIRQMEIAYDLYRLLDGLNDEEKRLIIATDIQGNTFGHLSKIWNIPVNTLLSRKSRALNKIQRQVQNKQKKKEKTYE